MPIVWAEGSRKSTYGNLSIMRLLEYLVEMFIQGFGITRPSEAQRRRVTLILGGALFTVLAAAVLLAVGMIFYLHNGR